MNTKIILFMLFFNKYIFSIENVTLPISVNGKIISQEENVINNIEQNLKEIRLTNNFSKDIFILGKTDTKSFLYKIEKGTIKTFKIEAKKITELFYILDGKKYKLEKYSNLKY